jgi:hypothetical protein
MEKKEKIKICEKRNEQKSVKTGEKLKFNKMSADSAQLF